MKLHVIPLACLLALGAWTVSSAAGGPSTPPQQPDPKKQPKEPKPDIADEFFAHGPIPRLRIELSPPELNKLRQNGREYATATVRELATADGQPEAIYNKVGIHLKGAAGSYRGVDDKPGLTLSFDKFVQGQAFHGLEKLHLNNSVQDPSYMSENLGNAIFRDAGIPAARVTYARVWINERDLGLFVLKEGFDDIFLKRFFPDHRGTLYEGQQRDVEAGLPERANKARKNPERLKELVAAAREGDAAARRQKLDKVLDVDRFLTFMALEAMTAHWDGYCGGRNNYRVYDDPATGKFVFLPHGTDQLFQQADFGVRPGGSMIGEAATGAAEDQARYLERVGELRQKVFTPERLGKRLDEISARLRPAMESISADAARRHKQQTEEFHRRIEDRIRSIDRQLGSTPKPLKFDAAVADLSAAQWQPQKTSGNATVDRADHDGKHRLHVRIEPGGEAAASWRTTVRLPRGKYTFEGPCRTTGVTAAGAGLRISGMADTKRLTGDAAWQQAQFDFEVTEDARDVVLVCELKAGAGEAWFDPDGMKLRRR